jgi:hypothetical protein
MLTPTAMENYVLNVKTFMHKRLCQNFKKVRDLLIISKESLDVAFGTTNKGGQTAKKPK